MTFTRIISTAHFNRRARKPRWRKATREQNLYQLELVCIINGSLSLVTSYQQPINNPQALGNLEQNYYGVFTRPFTLPPKYQKEEKGV